jgi:lysophospholipase L1-like esterase
VEYPGPTVTGGTPSVGVACVPASGSLFPVGSTTSVGCEATDAIGRRAACSFTVTMTRLLIDATRFLAFGDSVTAGEDGLASLALGRSILDLDHAYPTLLQSALTSDFPTQNMRVINEGRGGERATEGVARLGALLPQHRPDAVLLLEGYNDLIHDGAAAAGPIAEAMRQDIRLARGAGVRYIFLSQLTPPGVGKRMLPPNAIVQTNALIAQVAAAEGVFLVNPYDPFLGHESAYLADGLHPTAEGNRVIAETFLSVIREKIPAR